MDDHLQDRLGAVEELDGATSPSFRRLLVDAGDTVGRLDAGTLARALVERPEAVTVPDAADLIVLGSGDGATPGRLGLDRAAMADLGRGRCPVAVATRGLSGPDDYEPRRIDVGIDGSREAAAALAVAARLARVHDARLRLVAVAEHDGVGVGAPHAADPRELERLGRHLAHARDGLPGIRVEIELREGHADQILIELSHEADLLVLGSRVACGDRGRVSLGEVSTVILASAACPALVVPAP